MKPITPCSCEEAIHYRAALESIRDNCSVGTLAWGYAARALGGVLPLPPSWASDEPLERGPTPLKEGEKP